MAGNIVKQLAGSGTGQSFMDRMTAAKHSISGSALAKTVCKSTTEEIIAPKRKHLDYLTQCTNEPNVSIPQLADLIIQRTQTSNWVIVFKGLISLHTLMNYGNERFAQYLASNNCQLSLSTFTDKSGVQAYDMSVFVRQYSKYINDKAASYRLLAFDFCKVKRGKDDGVLRTMPLDKLLKTLPVLQNQLDVLLEFDATSNELTNHVVNAAFLLLYKDLIRLFATYNEGMINLIEKYFTMNKKQCRESLDLYKHFLKRMDKVNEFLKVAESLGCGDKDSLGLQSVPSSVLDALEQHLASLEGRKFTPKSTAAESTNTTTATNGSVRSSNTNTSVSGASTATVSAFSITDTERAKIIEEEQKRLAEFAKAKASSPQNLPKQQSQKQWTQPPSTTSTAASARPSDDLFLLGLDSGPTASSSAPALAANNPFAAPVAAPAPAPAQWSAFPPMGPPAQTAQKQPDDFNFETAFGNQQNNISSTTGFNSFNQILQPMSTASGSSPQQPTPAAVSNNTTPAAPTSDLDSKLASLAGNLTIGGPSARMEHKWGAQQQGPQQKTAGANTSGALGGTSINWAAPGVNPPAMAAPPATYSFGYAQPVTMAPWPNLVRMAQPNYQAPAGGMGMYYPPGAAPMAMGMPGPHPAALSHPHQPSSNNVNDPFGAL